jgi:hypothetical protein
MFCPFCFREFHPDDTPYQHKEDCRAEAALAVLREQEGARL